MSNATEMLAFYMSAEKAILQGQSVRYGERYLSRANLLEVQNGRRDWERRVNAENRTAAGGGSLRYLTPDFSE